MKPLLQKSEIMYKELTARKNANALYSHRAFSRDLEVSHSLLSLVLNGKRPVSPELAKKLIQNSRHLNEHDRSVLNLGLELKARKSFKLVSLDFLSLISHWSYFALLSLLETVDFEWSTEFISKRLKLSQEKTRDLMRKVTDLGLVKKNENGQWKQSSDPIATENPNPTESTKKFNRELLLKAIESMENDHPDLRDLSSITFAMDPVHLPYAVQKIREFRRSLCQELEDMGNPQEAYTVSVQIFPLSHPKDRT